jgi:hypothetical protein
MRDISILILIIICGARSASAGIYCTAPEVPTFYETKPTKPSIPFCSNEFSNTNTCDELTIDDYNARVDDYNDKLSKYQSSVDFYVFQLNKYVRDAQAYARCEASYL